MSKSVLHTIEDRMAAFSKGQKRIAHYILDHYDQAAFMTASKLGKLTEVSESTVVRFAAELGYDGYPSMQKALQEMARSRLTSTQRIQAAENSYGDDILGSVIQADMENLRQIAVNEDRGEFRAAVERIVAAKHIYIFGAPVLYASGGVSLFLYADDAGKRVAGSGKRRRRDFRAAFPQRKGGCDDCHQLSPVLSRYDQCREVCKIPGH